MNKSSMLGVAGYFGIDEQAAAIRQSANHILRDSDMWTEPEVGLALGGVEFAGAGACTPTVTPGDRYVIALHGAIYNSEELGDSIKDESGHCDPVGNSSAETLLAALSHWGLDATLQRVNGDFSFALWDRQARQLLLARDRLGVKPMYYGRSGETFLCGSSLQALTAHPDWHGQVEREALSQYLRYSYVPAPWSIYKGVFKLPPAHYVVIGSGGREVGEPQCYWGLGDIAAQGVAADPSPDKANIDALDGLLRESVARRMQTHGQAGAFLSGGYDSSTVAALMQAQSEQPIKTFSIGFQNAGYNEATHAKAVAEHLGTDHTELYVTPEQAMAVVAKLPAMYDEPFADASQIPTFLVNELAGEQEAVALGGDGGDELFCGYNRHIAGVNVWNKLARLPYPLRRATGWFTDALVRMNVDRWAGWLPGLRNTPQLGTKLDKLASALQAKDGLAFYRDLVSHWKDPVAVVKGAPSSFQRRQESGGVGFGSEVGEHVEGLDTRLRGYDGIWCLREQMMLWDALTYLPGGGLTKVHGASRAAGVQARLPMLDHRIVEFAWRVPMSQKLRDGRGKWLLRQVLYQYVPSELMDRPKMGFSVPIDDWLRGPLREWAEDLLDSERLEREGYFHPQPIRQVWKEHLSGRHNHGQRLWIILMFQAWLEN